MFNRTNLLIVLVALIGAVLGLLVGKHLDFAPTAAIPDGMQVLETGDRRADLNLSDTSGAPHRLSEWDGKPVLVNFWATWCGPCRDEMPLLDHARSRFASEKLEVIGVAVDNGDAVRDFLRQNPVHYPIMLSDEREDAALQFGDRRSVLPYSVLVGSDGKILAQRSGSFSEFALTAWLESHLSEQIKR